MKEISKRTLSILVVVALAVSVFSTFINLQKLNGLDDITGRLSATDLGTVNLTVAAAAYINITDNLIEFGTMEVTWTNYSEQLGTNGDFFEVRNDGSVQINVSIYDTDGNGDIGLFTSATTTGCSGTSGVAGDDVRCIFARCNISATGDPSCNETFQELGAAQASAPIVISYFDQYDRGNISLQLTVPSDEDAGVKEATMTLYAEAAN